MADLIRCPQCRSEDVSCSERPHRHVCHSCGFDGSRPAAPSPVSEEGPQPLNLDAVQAQVDTWTRQFRPTPEAAADPMADALCIAEEAGEVCRAVLKRSHGKRPDVDWSAQLRDEVGDVVIGLLSLAANEGWSLADAVTERWAEVSQRGATPEQGEGPTAEPDYEAMVCLNCAVPNPLCNEDIPCVAEGGKRFKRHDWAARGEGEQA